MLERWLGFAPMIVLMGIFGCVIPRVTRFEGIFTQLGVDPPALTKAALWISRNFVQLYLLWLPAAFAICWGYFAYMAKSRPRVLWFSLLTAFLVVISLSLFLGGTLLPIFKIQEALRKK